MQRRYGAVQDSPYGTQHLQFRRHNHLIRQNDGCAGLQQPMLGLGLQRRQTLQRLIEGAVIEAAQEVMQSRQPRLLEFGVSDEQAWQVGLACGGRVQVFVEPVE